MSDRAKPHTLALAIEPLSDPITGRITFENGVEQAFCGYMQLVDALERVRRRALASNSAEEAREPESPARSAE